MIDKYMNSYLDRRMKYLIEEWQIATKNDIADFDRRIKAISTEADKLEASGKAAETRLVSLETRAQALEARKR